MRNLAGLAMDCSAYKAAQDGNTDFLKNRINISEVLCQETIQQKDNLLHIAANSRQKKFAEETIRLNQSLLYQANLKGDTSLLYQANLKGDTPLHTAARTGCSGIVDLFISIPEVRGDDIESNRENGSLNLLRMVNQEGDTALHVAVRYGHLNVVESLVEADIKLLHMENNANETPLLNMKNKANETPLLNMKNKANEFPLYLAVERGFFDIAKHILIKCPTCSHSGTKGMTALHAAVVRTHNKGIEYGSTSIPVVSLEGLRSSTRGFSLSIIQFFIGNTSQNSHERDINPVDVLSLEGLRRSFYNIVFKLQNYLSGPVSRQTDDIIAILLEKKKDMVREKDIFTWTPLHYAAQLGHLKATKKLLECDKSVAYMWDEEVSSALHIAAKEGYINILEEITKQCSCAYNLVDNKGRSILHVAAQCGKSQVVKYILNVKSWENLINEPDNEGNTALHLAAICGHYKSVSILAGDIRVDKRATNKKYLKAIDIVQSNTDVGEIRKYLIMRKLENGGAQQSLEQLIIRKNTHRKINDNEGQKEGINKSELGEDRERIPLHASDALHDRNNEVEKKKEIKSKYLKDVSNTHLLVATLIATVTFAAGFSLPGGYNQENPKKGQSVLSTESAFKAFVITDAIAFYCSTAAVFLHFFASLEQNYHLLQRFVKFAALLTYISLLAMVMAFASGIYVVLPNSSPLSTSLIVLGSLFLGFYIFGIL